MSGYYRTGRGGAGNMKTEQEIKAEFQRSQETDPEATAGNGDVLSRTVSVANTIAEEKAKHPGEGYKHLGRGGAGNWFTPSTTPSSAAPAPEEQQEPITTATEAAIAAAAAVGTPSSATAGKRVSVQQQPQMRVWSGRGGAGNFMPQPQEEKGPMEIEMEQKEQAKRVEEEVRKKVEMVLERPGRAHVQPHLGERGERN